MSSIVYPKLSLLIDVNKIPSELGGVQQGLQFIFDRLYYEDCQILKSPDGAQGEVEITLMSLEKLGFDLGGANGISFVLNPGSIPAGGSPIPLKFTYEIEALKYLRGLELSSFSGSPQEIFDLVLKMIGRTKQELLAGFLGSLYPQSFHPLHDFISHFNNVPGFNGTPLAVVNFADPFTDIVTQIENNGMDVIQFIWDEFLDPVSQSLSVTQIIDNIKGLVQGWLGDVDLQNIGELFKPKVSASLQGISAAIEFPRSILVPLDTNHDPLPGNSSLDFTIGEVTYSLEKGFAFDWISSLTFTRSEVAGLGIVLEMNGLLLDYWENFLIPEAVRDGRPGNFKGVYAEEATVFLPKFWQPNSNQNDTAKITGSNLLIGDPGGISGTFVLEDLPNQTNGLIHFVIPGNIEVSLDTFDLTLVQNQVTQSSIQGSLAFPGLDSNGNPTAFAFDVTLENDIGQGTKKYIVEVQGAVSAALGNIQVAFNTLKLGFDDNGIVLGDTVINGNITFPSLTDNNGQPEAMGFGLTVNTPPNAPSTYTVQVSNPPTLNLFGVEVDFANVIFSFNENGIQNPTSIDGNLFFPGAVDNNNLPVPMAFALEVDNPNKRYILDVGSVPTLSILGMELNLGAFQIEFDDNGIHAAVISGTLLLPQTSNGSGQSQPINIDFEIDDNSGDKSFTITATNFPTLYLGEFELTFNQLSFTFEGSTITTNGISGQMRFPGMTGPSLAFSLVIGSNGVYTISVNNPPPLTLGPVSVQFNNFTLSWDKNGFVTPFAIGGTLEIEGLDDSNGNTQPIAFGFDVNNGIYQITASAPPLHIGDTVITVQNFLIAFDQNGITNGSLTGYLEMDGFKSNTQDPAQIGMTITIDQNGFKVLGDVQGIKIELEIPEVLKAEVFTAWVEKSLSVWEAGFTGRLDVLLDVPALDKVLPETIFIDQFSVDNDNPPNTELELRFVWPGADEINPDPLAGLTLYIPVNKTILNTIFIQGIELKAKELNPGLELEARMDNTTLKLGPVLASVEGLGMGADLSFPSNGGNLGPLDVDLKVLYPTGLGILLDTDAVKGGGFISFDQPNERYYGALELTIKELISLKAVGILTTRMPDGSKGFSFLVVISANFPPIQLGFGFTLEGVGGLVGIHRTMQLDALRQGVRTNAIDNILFPNDPVGNITQIVSDLESVFPAAQDRYAFGLMANMGWGTPKLIDIELGLMIEVPAPIRLAILGVLKVILPDEAAALVKIQVNFLGTIDFERKFMTFDASLFESRLLHWTLAGDMAFRMKWGENSSFLFSLGGFHPDFTPPPLDLPAMQRITVNLLGGDNPRLTLSSYFAVTSNTVQFGAGVDFYYKITKKIRVVGFLRFDVLFQFSPFYFIVSFEAMLAVMRNNTTLLGIYLRVLLEGPTPWRAQGKAEFKILGAKFKVKFDKTFGQNKDTNLPNIDVANELIEAVDDARSWSVSTPESTAPGVTLREFEPVADELLVQPNSTISLDQGVVPLQTSISRFGNKQPAAHRKFDIDLFEAGNKLGDQLLRNEFAPNDFFELSNSQKLSRPSFERYPSGKQVQLSVNNQLESGLFREKKLTYEVGVIDAMQSPTALGYSGARTAPFNSWTRNTASGRSSFGDKAKGRSPLLPNKVTAGGRTYAIATRSDFSHYNNLTAPTEAEARQLYTQLMEDQPELEGTLQIVPTHELN